MDDNYGEALDFLRLLPQKGLDSTIGNLLRGLLQVQRNREIGVEFSEVYDRFSEINGGNPKTRPYVHRLLNTLIESKVIRVHGTEGKNRRYGCDINTLATGLSYLKERVLHELVNEKQRIEESSRFVEKIDTIDLAQWLHEELTGEKKIPTSRFLKNIDEFHRITDETIYQASKAGDVIRTSVANAGPFVNGYTDRIRRIFVAAQKGAEVRYAVPPSVLQSAALTEGKASQEMNKQILNAIVNERKSCPGLHMRINPAGPKSHQFVSLNDQVMALWISETPPTAAWLTREFNADLIDHIIDTFDEQWDKALLVREILDAEMEKRVTGQSS